MNPSVVVKRRHGQEHHRFLSKPVGDTNKGAQYAGSAFTNILKGHGIGISMDGKGRVPENIMAERLSRTVSKRILLSGYGSTSTSTTGRVLTKPLWARPRQRLTWGLPSQEGGAKMVESARIFGTRSHLNSKKKWSCRISMEH